MLVDVPLPGFVEVASAFTYALFTVLWVRGTLGMYIRYLLAFTFNPHGMFEGGLSQSCMKVMDMISGKAKHKVKDCTFICCAIFALTWTGITSICPPFCGLWHRKFLIILVGEQAGSIDIGMTFSGSWRMPQSSTTIKRRNPSCQEYLWLIFNATGVGSLRAESMRRLKCGQKESTSLCSSYSCLERHMYLLLSFSSARSL